MSAQFSLRSLLLLVTAISVALGSFLRWGPIGVVMVYLALAAGLGCGATAHTLLLAATLALDCAVGWIIGGGVYHADFIFFLDDGDSARLADAGALLGCLVWTTTWLARWLTLAAASLRRRPMLPAALVLIGAVIGGIAAHIAWQSLHILASANRYSTSHGAGFAWALWTVSAAGVGIIHFRLPNVQRGKFITPAPPPP